MTRAQQEDASVPGANEGKQVSLFGGDNADRSDIENVRRSANATAMTTEAMRHLVDSGNAYEALLEMFKDADVALAEASAVLGTGFDPIDKDELIGRSFILADWRISMPEKESYGRPYVVARGVRRDDAKPFLIVDGSAGICEQLISLTDSRMRSGSKSPNIALNVPAGLTRSDYEIPNPDEKLRDKVPTVPASTYYLGTTAEPQKRR